MAGSGPLKHKVAALAEPYTVPLRDANGDMDLGPALAETLSTMVTGLDWQESVIAQQNAPPGAPADGDRYLVGAAPAGAWVGHANDIAVRSAGAWTFIDPNKGYALYDETALVQLVYNGAAWVEVGAGSGDFMADGSVPMTGTLDLGGNALRIGPALWLQDYDAVVPGSAVFHKGDPEDFEDIIAVVAPQQFLMATPAGGTFFLVTEGQMQLQTAAGDGVFAIALAGGNTFFIGFGDVKHAASVGGSVQLTDSAGTALLEATDAGDVTVLTDLGMDGNIVFDDASELSILGLAGIAANESLGTFSIGMASEADARLYMTFGASPSVSFMVGPSATPSDRYMELAVLDVGIFGLALVNSEAPAGALWWLTIEDADGHLRFHEHPAGTDPLTIEAGALDGLVTLGATAVTLGGDLSMVAHSIYAARVAGGLSVLADGATPALDAALGTVFTLVAAGDRTIAVPTNPENGQRIIIRHTASGAARTLALNTGAGGFRFGSDITALTATPDGETDYIGAVYNEVDDRWDVISYTKGFPDV